MTRFTVASILVCLCASLGMTGDGCVGVPAEILSLRQPPAIIPTNPAERTLHRTFEVDFRSYTEADSVTWDFGDGAVTTNLTIAKGRRVAHEFTRSGTFTVSVHLFAMDSLSVDSSHIASASLPVELVGPNAEPNAWFIIEDMYDDNGQLLTLSKRMIATRSSDPDGRIVSYRWNFGDGTTDSGETIEHTYASSGRYNVVLRVTDDLGETDTTSRAVLVNSPPTASFEATSTGGDGLTWSFDAAASSDAEGGISQFKWDFGDGSVEETGMLVVHTYAEPADYTVKLTVVDEFGASTTTEQIVDVTGVEPFVRSIDPAVGETGTTLSDAVIDGENFVDGAAVRLEGTGSTIEADSVTIESDSRIVATFDLSNAATGTYTVVVANPGEVAAQLTDGFKVVTTNLVRLETSMGDMVFELVDDAPITTANFLQYIEDGFYEGTIFHRVIPDFMAQGGGHLPDMTQPEGLRDPIQNEFSSERSNVRGTVAMAKLGNDPDSATSQFFVNVADNSDNLDNQNGGFTVFANVIEGMDVADAMTLVDRDGSDKPLEDIMLIRVIRE